MSHHIVEVKNLKFTYPDGTCALQDISFRITHGESVAVGRKRSREINPSSPFKRVPHVRKRDYPDRRLPFNKRDIKRGKANGGNGFQDPDDQLFMPTVYDDVAFGPLNLSLPPEEVDTRVDNALSTVGALHLKSRPPYRLSGGEKRSVSIATVLAMSPDILVMDEPTSNLDPRARRKLIELLKTFKHTKIIATHDLDMVMDLCERTIVIHKGQVMADGPTAEIFMNQELLAESHLEKPLRMQGCPVCGNK